MPLIINSTTNLNKLKFTSSGGDRWDQGKSGQPYIVSPIPGVNDTFQQQLDGQPLPSGGVDFLLRGGDLSITAAENDVSRLSKMLFDTRSPNGFEFIAKQNVLSRNSVKTEGTFGVGYGFGLLNQGVYTPVGTLLQTGLAPIATGATNLFGANPLTDNTALSLNNGIATRTSNGGINGYFGVVNAQNIDGSDGGTANRLARILKGVSTGDFSQTTVGGSINLYPDSQTILRYGGGPKSLLGIGKTSIPFVEPLQRTGVKNSKLPEGFISSPTNFSPFDANYSPGIGDYTVFKRNQSEKTGNYYKITDAASGPLTGEGLFNTFIDNENDINNLVFETDSDNPFTPNLVDKTVLDNNPSKASKFKTVGGPDIFEALNGSSPTLSQGIYGGTDASENAQIKKSNIFVSGSTVSGIFAGLFPDQKLSLLTAAGGTIGPGGGLTVNLNKAKYTEQAGGAITNNLSPYTQTYGGNSTQLVGEGKLLDSYTHQAIIGNTIPQQFLYDQPLKSTGNGSGLSNPRDFRKHVNGEDFNNNTEMENNLGFSTVLSLAPDYVNANQNIKTNYGDPGQTAGQTLSGFLQPAKNVLNYGVDASTLIALDKINAMPLYEDTAADTLNKGINDSVNFNIAVINNDKADGTSTYIHFRALLDDFNDSYTAKWDAVQYVGRGEELYNYQGFGREISMGWTVYAQSKAELIPMYKKLNYLASTLAPDYIGAGMMRGNIVKITVGGYLYDQPGIIKSINFGIPEESPWEIAINEEGLEDTSVKQLPHMIKVTGFTFIPIHKFIPAKVSSLTNPIQKYIALANSTGNTNYKDKYKSYSQAGAQLE